MEFCWIEFVNGGRFRVARSIDDIENDVAISRESGEAFDLPGVGRVWGDKVVRVYGDAT